MTRHGATRQRFAALLTSGPRCAAGGLAKQLDKCNGTMEKLEKLKSNRQGPGTSGAARAAGPRQNRLMGHWMPREDACEVPGWRANICARKREPRILHEDGPGSRLQQAVYMHRH